MIGPKTYYSLFPPRYQRALEKAGIEDRITEIRMRSDLPFSLTAFDGNYFVGDAGLCERKEDAIICEKEDLRHVVGTFCRGSLYRFFDTLQSGYITNENGVRLGIVPNKDETGPFLPESVAALNLRIPRDAPDAANELLAFFRQTELVSTLILSPPGGGKTTLLRALAAQLSTGPAPKRVAVIDERKELFPKNLKRRAGLCDVFSGYSKEEGMEIAARVFNPEVMVLDEIGGEKDARAILALGRRGTILFASAHAQSFEEARQAKWLRLLWEEGLFGRAAFLNRLPGKTFSCEITWGKLV